jgi:hypothetical protein
MKKLVCTTLALAFFTSLSAFAQQPAPAARRAPQPPPLFFREGWKDTAAIPVTQEGVANADLELKVYGATKDDMTVNNEGGVPHVWTGLCPAGCAVVLKHKESYADLTGKARIRWYTKTSGFHEIRPIIKLSDGTWLVGDHADAYTYDFHESEFFLAEVRWLKLDIQKVQTKGTLLDKVDLSKVDEIGFVDLTPGSGHGQGGYSDVGWIEVYAKPVKREAATTP